MQTSCQLVFLISAITACEIGAMIIHTSRGKTGLVRCPVSELVRLLQDPGFQGNKELNKPFWAQYIMFITYIETAQILDKDHSTLPEGRGTHEHLMTAGPEGGWRGMGWGVRV